MRGSCPSSVLEGCCCSLLKVQLSGSGSVGRAGARVGLRNLPCYRASRTTWGCEPCFMTCRQITALGHLKHCSIQPLEDEGFQGIPKISHLPPLFLFSRPIPTIRGPLGSSLGSQDPPLWKGREGSWPGQGEELGCTQSQPSPQRAREQRWPFRGVRSQVGGQTLTFVPLH